MKPTNLYDQAWQSTQEDSGTPDTTATSTQVQSPQPTTSVANPSVTFSVPLQVTISVGAATLLGGALAAPRIAAESSMLQTEAVPVPDFEVPRAIGAYIPLLQNSYALAAQQPVQLPNGYTRLADIRVSAAEAVAGTESTLTPAQQRAVEHDRKALAHGASLDFAEGIADPGAFGFVVREESTGSILISIRGTQTPAEWLADFSPVPVPFFESPGMGLVHVGFAVFYRKVRQSIKAVLDTLDPALRVTVIGHSLGGGMAILCAADIERNMGKKNVDVCTFGGPRTGKIDFRIRFNAEVPKCFRVVNALDIVPHVPLPITGWSHVGVEVSVKGKGPSAHSLDAYLDGLKHLGQPGTDELVGAGPQVMAIRVP